MQVDIKQLKTSLRIDSDEDDALLNGYSMAAEQYVKNAVGTDFPSFWDKEEVKPLLETAIIALASGYYSFRTSLSLVQSYPVDLATDSIISQLRGEYERFSLEEVKNGNKSS
ncbi:head-tail connector protein [Convivina intestini]|uniref:head-tail connector protein n=1 Tax=Convivina intestini TaxID=1505726 RepID=UPI00200D8807|nr:head-tail connector protein [Convivina intestini]CAH1857511.1 hypothetical protein R077811_01544 [Convivina intestini]